MHLIKKFVKIQHIRKQSIGLKLFFTIFLTLLPTIHMFYSSYGHQRKVLILNKEHVISFFQCLEKLVPKPNIITKLQLTVDLHASTTQAIQAFCVETQPQATGRKIPNKDNKKGRFHVCTCKRDRKLCQKCCKCYVCVCNDPAQTTVICANCIV